jgi:hypothetical protein
MKTKRMAARHMQPSQTFENIITDSLPQDPIFEIEKSAMYEPEEVPAFPSPLLPDPVAKFIKQAAEALPCPEDYIGLAVLAVASTVLGNSVQLEIKNSWTESALLWCCAIGDPSVKKTPAMEKAFAPLDDLQKRNYEEYKQLKANYELNYQHYEEELAEWQQKYKAKKATIEEKPFPPSKPTFEQMIVMDATMEALYEVLQFNERGIIKFHDELAGFFTSMNQYRTGADRQLWLQMYSRKPITINRVGKEAIMIDKPFVTVLGGIQPDKLEVIISKDGNDGMPDRFLYVYPEPIESFYTEKDLDPAVYEKYKEVIEKLYDLNKDPKTPLTVRFSAAAKEIFIGSYDNITLLTKEADFPDRLISPYMKMQGLMARIALVLHMLKCASYETKNIALIDEETMIFANYLVNYFLQHARKAFLFSQSNPQELKIQKMIKKLKEKGEETPEGYQMTLRDITRSKVLGDETSKESILEVWYAMQDEKLGMVIMEEGYRGKTKFYFTLFK